MQASPHECSCVPTGIGDKDCGRGYWRINGKLTGINGELNICRRGSCTPVLRQKIFKRPKDLSSNDRLFIRNYLCISFIICILAAVLKIQIYENKYRIQTAYHWCRYVLKKIGHFCQEYFADNEQMCTFASTISVTPLF